MSYGTIVSSDGRVDCGASCAGDWKAGTTAHLSARANPGARFGGWGGECSAWGAAPEVDVLMDRSYECNPYFGPGRDTQFWLSVNDAGSAPVWIRSADGMISCGDDPQGNHYDQCGSAYDSGFGVVLTEFPASLGAFEVVWGGDCSGTGTGTVVYMDANKNCNLTLTPRPP